MTKSEDATKDECHPVHTKTVIIVGLGVAGFAAAIECRLRGYKVLAFEKSDGEMTKGDVFGLASNAMAVIDHWDNGSVAASLRQRRCYSQHANWYNEDGAFKYKEKLEGFQPGEGCILPRADCMHVFREYAKRLGVEMYFQVAVSGYWENDKEAGIVANGRCYSGDCVIACDGISSMARKTITGRDAKYIDLGITAIRSPVFPVAAIEGIPGAQWFLEGTKTEDKFFSFLGKDVIVNLGTSQKGKLVYWANVQKGHNETATPWTQPADLSEVLASIKHWPAFEKVAPILSRTPLGQCYMHQLCVMTPIDTWTSKHARMMVIGDAAHSFSFALTQGASQAIEDAAVLAICLELSGTDNIPRAFLTTEKLRMPRTTALHELDMATLRNFHATVWGDSESVTPHSLDSVCVHDCRAHAYENFAKVAASA